MENRKNLEADLTTKRPLFFNLGLVIALSLVIAAFEWKSVIELGRVDVANDGDNAVEMLYIPKTIIETPKPPKPKQVQPKIVLLSQIVEGDESQSSDVIPVTDLGVDESAISDIMTDGPVEEIIEPPVDFAAEPASFPGGEKALSKFLASNLKYPKKANDRNIQGTAYARFVIDKDGSVTDIEIVRGLGFGIDEEIIRVLKMSPKWNPGKQSHRLVRQRMIIPVRFNIN